MDYARLVDTVKIVLILIIGIVIGRVSMAIEYAFITRKKKD